MGRFSVPLSLSLHVWIKRLSQSLSRNAFTEWPLRLAADPYFSRFYILVRLAEINRDTYFDILSEFDHAADESWVPETWRIVEAWRESVMLIRNAKDSASCGSTDCNGYNV